MASSVYKWLLIPLICLLMAGKPAPHPFHVSVIEINHNAADKTLEISCKIFTDDFEKILAKNYQRKVDLINPSDKAPMDSLVKKYILSHLVISANDKPEAAYSYIEVENIPVLNKIGISTNIMYDQFEDQVNIMHVIVNGNRKSTKLNFPETEAEIVFSH